MSYIRNLFLGLVLVFSCFSVSPLLAQTITDTNSLISATKEEISIMNSTPEVYVSNLSLDKSEYKGGDTVKGSFFVINSKSEQTPSIFFNIYLAGKYDSKGILNSEDYSVQKSESVFLSPNEKREVKFSYQLPLSNQAYSTNKLLKIKVRFFTNSGWPLGWQDVPIKVVGLNSVSLNIEKANIEIGKNVYEVQEGPTIKPGEKALLKIKVNNPTQTSLSFTPILSFYGKDTNLLVKKYSEKEILVKAGASLDLSYELPNFEAVAGVYTGSISFETNGYSSNLVHFRYIVGGNIANIRNITSDKSLIKKGENLNLNILLTGTPVDIANLAGSASSSLVNFDLKVFGEKKSLIASYNKQVRLSDLSKPISLIALDSARDLRVEAVVSESGKILSEYKAELLSPKTNEPLTPKIFWIILFIIVLAVLVLIFIFIKNKMLKKTIVTSFLFLLMCLPLFRAEAFTVESVSYPAGYAWSSADGGTQVQINSPVGNYAPGQTFNLTGTVYIRACSNGPSRIVVYAKIGDTNFGAPLYDSGAFGVDGNSEIHYGSSKDFNVSGFTAPSTSGEKRLYVKVETYYYRSFFSYNHQTSRNSFLTSVLQGYQSFNVVSPNPVDSSNPTGLSVSCPAPGTSGTVSWSAVPGASGYALRINNLSNSWNDSCDPVNSGDVCVNTSTNNYTFTGTAGASYDWWVHSIVNGVLSPASSGGAFTCTAPSAQLPLLDTEEPPVPSKDPVELNVNKVGEGWVVSEDSRIYCGDFCSSTYESGQSVKLLASPNIGQYFVGWSGACSGVSSTCNLSMNGNKTVTANFATLALPDEIPVYPNCSISITNANPKNEVSVNTNTTWNISGASLTGNGYTQTLVTDNAANPGSFTSTFNKIFTTTGLKNVNVYFASSTGAYFCKDKSAQATTTVVFPGHSSEI